MRVKYISILRGINVSGHKKIKMADLKSLYELLGFQNVLTYIQSGNVIFDTEAKSKTDLKARIEKAIEEKYGFHVPVVIRTDLEIANIVKNNPLGPINLAKDGSKVLVTLLSSKPAKNKIHDIQKTVAAPEELVVKGEEAYLHCPNGYGRSKLSNNFIERILGVEATTRNLKTVHKLHELSLS